MARSGGTSSQQSQRYVRDCVCVCVYVWNQASSVRVGVDRGAPFRPQHCVQSLRSACGVPKPSHKTPEKKDHSRHSENCFGFWTPPTQHIRLSQYKSNIIWYGTMDPGWVSECQTRKEPGNMNNSMLFGKTLQNFRTPSELQKSFSSSIFL